MSYFFHFILFILGLAVGSFLNVVSFRFKPEDRVFDWKKLGGRSACPYCHKTLYWYELIPLVSFFIQKRKCRTCGGKLSWQYPLVELLSGLILATAPGPVWIFILLVLLLISLIDFRHYFIPDELIWLLAFLGLISVFLKTPSFLGYYAAIFNYSNNIWVNHILGALVGGIFFGLFFYLGRGKIMGGGDVKLGAALGWILGWPDIIVTLLISFLLGGGLGLILLLGRRKTAKDFLPLAPFLTLGVVLTVFFGYQIINNYFALAGL
jgi:leader peptidase (prepilin peptidase)/N-methyltransferase